jgi:hypothetical protein
MLTLIEIQKSPVKYKKYRATALLNGELYKDVDFGSLPYQQYQDRTPLKLYSDLDHKDTKRLRLYHARHKNNNGIASLLAKKYLW